MNIYTINFAYFRSGKAATAGSVKVIAKDSGEAEKAFSALHPDGSTFWYAITGVEAIAMEELF